MPSCSAGTSSIIRATRVTPPFVVNGREKIAMKKLIAEIAALVALSTAANAGIVCHDGYQVVGGSEISTPYCRDNVLARVARGHGREVSDAAVRNNPGLKDELCRFLESDI